MSRKSIIAILSAVVLMVVASIAMVFTVGPMTSAADNMALLNEERYFNINDITVTGISADGLAMIHGGKFRIVIPSRIKYIGMNAFKNYTGLTSVLCNQNLYTIGNYAFRNCSNLTSITMPSGVDTIGTGAFWGCTSLNSITIPDSISIIGDDAFYSCTNLTSITVDEANQYFYSDDGNCIVRSFNNALICGCKNTVIPSRVTSISSYAFYGSAGLTSIIIPENVTSIGEGAFYNCSGLTSITIPEGVTSIGEYAFNGCTNLTEIVIENPALIDSVALASYKDAGYLHYSQNTVTFDSKNGTAVTDQIVEYKTNATEPDTPVRDGYTFNGWYTDEYYNSVFDFTTPITDSITLFAKWEVNPTITFMVDGTEYSSETVEYNTMVSIPNDEPIKQHYIFVGWYLNNVKYNFAAPVTENITLTAKWQPIKYTVTFNSNGGSNVNSRQVDYGTTTTSPTSSKTGYKLLCWKLNGVIFDFANTAITEDITLVAEWERLCVVSFDTNGGYEIESQYVEKNGYAYFGWTEKPYYNLVGWKLNGETFDFANTAITEDITLVADWAIYTYEVTFNSNGGTSVSKQTVEHGAKVMIPTDPTRDGYFFCGWYRIGTNSATEYDFETPVTEYMTLTAVWKKIYNITFANANGEVYTTRAVVEGDLVQAPDITVDGYLVSWYAGDKAYDFTTPVTADMTLTAQLDENSVKVNNQNNSALIWGIAGTAAGILVIGGLITGIVIAKRRRK